jgi:cytoskeleton protein RodZ
MIDSDIGGRVRLAREQRGLTLGDAARLTKLSTSVLRAIEQNDFASLPTGMYRKAYLRTVAAEVGLDPVEIAVDYEAQYEALAGSPTAATGRTPRDGWVLPSAYRTILTVIVVAMLLAAWFVLQHDSAPVRSSSVTPFGSLE